MAAMKEDHKKKLAAFKPECAECATLRKEARDAKTSKASIEIENRNLKGMLKDERIFKNQFRELAANAVSVELFQEFDKLSNQQQELRDDNANLRNINNDLRARASEFEENRKTFVGMLQEKEIANQKYRQELNGLRRRNTQLAQENTQLVQENTRLAQEIEQLQVDLAIRESTNKYVKDQLLGISKTYR
jgi:regulator of replication initiation timing